MKQFCSVTTVDFGTGREREASGFLATEGGSREMPPSAGRKAANEGGGQSLSADRVTVALIPKAGEDLQRLQKRTGLSKTDLVNRAISVYEFIEAQRAAGNDLIIRDAKTGEAQLVRLL